MAIESQDTNDRLTRMEEMIAGMIGEIRNLQNNQQPPVQNAPPPPPGPQPNNANNDPVAADTGPSGVVLQGENPNANQRPAEVLIDERRVWNFQKMKPPTFESGLNVTQAEEWLTEMEKIFRVTQCTEIEKTTLATYIQSEG